MVNIILNGSDLRIYLMDTIETIMTVGICLLILASSTFTSTGDVIDTATPGHFWV
jgi:hypothetical protein